MIVDKGFDVLVNIGVRKVKHKRFTSDSFTLGASYRFSVDNWRKEFVSSESMDIEDMTSGGHSRIIPPLFVLLKLHNKRIHVHIAIKYFIITIANIMIKMGIRNVNE